MDEAEHGCYLGRRISEGPDEVEVAEAVEVLEDDEVRGELCIVNGEEAAAHRSSFLEVWSFSAISHLSPRRSRSHYFLKAIANILETFLPSTLHGHGQYF